MRKFFLISMMALVSLFMFNSCSSDRSDDDSSSSQARYNVTGTWDFNQSKFDGAWQDISVLNYYITLNSNNTYSTNMLDVADTGTYVYDKKDLIVTTSKEYGSTNIRIVSMNGSDAEVVMTNAADASDRVELRLKKR